MKCPACYNDLSEVQAGNLRVDVCHQGCGGIWFDAFELQRADEVSDSAGEALLEIRRDESVQVDPSRKRECPRCQGIKLHRHFFSARRRVQVDQCPNCGGYWLDAGELALIREEKAEVDAAGKISATVVSNQFIRYVYRLKSDSNPR
jgi:Zn-finger nucleic acid-binding protein